MIPGSRATKIASVLVAGGLHAAMAAVLVVPERIEVEGAGETAEVRLGTAFTDLVEGTAIASSFASNEPIRPTVSSPTRDERALTILQPTKPEPLAQKAPTSAEQLPIVEPQGRVNASAVAMLSKPPTLRPEAAAHANAPDIRSPLATRLKPVEHYTPAGVRKAIAIDAEAAAPLPSQKVDQVAVAIKRPVLAPNQSLRPAERPERTEPRIEASRAEDRSPATAAGNANRTERAGSPDARTTGDAATSGDVGAIHATGNAAATNYPGEVMRCISRAAPLNRNRGGTAVVTFGIDGSGHINNVSLSASSGDARLDRAAIRAISSAGPCPRPPRGANARFSIRIE